MRGEAGSAGLELAGCSGGEAGSAGTRGGGRRGGGEPEARSARPEVEVGEAATHGPAGQNHTIGVPNHDPLGLAQVQLRSPKVAVATGTVARALKNGTTFLQKIKSSSPIKFEYVRPLSHRLRVQSIKFGIVQVDVRTSTYEHLRLLR